MCHTLNDILSRNLVVSLANAFGFSLCITKEPEMCSQKRGLLEFALP